MNNKILKVEGGDVKGATNGLLKELLSAGKVEALLLTQDTPSGGASFPVLISDPEMLNANIFAPVLPVSTARALSKLTQN